ncbi:unnamed protein product, partial [Ectocarpus sp. 6 AP-2014]
MRAPRDGARWGARRQASPRKSSPPPPTNKNLHGQIRSSDARHAPIGCATTDRAERFSKHSEQPESTSCTSRFRTSRRPVKSSPLSRAMAAAEHAIDQAKRPSAGTSAQE